MTSSYQDYECNSIEAEIRKQSDGAGWENFICSKCRHYDGGVICKENVFIAFTGANMKGCIYFEEERRKGNR